MSGYFKHYWPNGKLAHEGKFINGGGNANHLSGIPILGREGLHIFYWKNGAKTAELPFKNGELNGTAKEYWENGILKYQSKYENGISYNTKNWDKNGKPD